MILLLPSQSTVLNAYAVLIGATPGNAALKEHQEFIRINGDAGYTLALNNVFKAYTNATMATALLANTGLGGVFTQADAEAYLAANAGNRVGAMISLANELYNYGGTNAALLSAKTAYMASIESSYVYSSVALNTNGQALAGVGVQTVALTTGFDALVGGAMNDTFLARTLNNANTLQDGDSINGGAGQDTLVADLVSQTNAITPLLTNIETVVIRAQTTTRDVTNGNNQTQDTVFIDAQRSLAVDSLNTVTAGSGVTRWESNNSRSDVIIEDVRIGNEQKTSDVTIAFVESDPGNVDFGVYFDQHSLRNASTGTSTLTIQLMDTGAAAATTTAATPLLNQPYDTFKFAVNGVMATVALNPTGSTTVAANADTYAQLLAAFQTALVGTGATAALGANFTVTDPISGKPVTGQSIVLTGGAGTVITTPAGSGWFNTTGAAVPATANIYNTFATGATNQTELVTSKIVLDDVGRGSTGGDLVVGGMSVGTTSTSRGVERFEITVNDNSKLQTINSTNNALREVTIVNGATSKTVANAYTTTVTNEGDLTVNGTVGIADTILAGVDAYSRGTTLPGGVAVTHAGTGAAGFTDVRLIDASLFKGKLAFTAAITSDSIPKYVTAVDTSVNPAADVATVGGNSNFGVAGANFIYTGGNDNDTMVVTIDATAASSRSSIVSGLSDMTFKLNGGAGNDAITTTVINTTLAGGAQAWYNNQKLNANISIDAGEGNDTVRTPGAGDVVIDAGAGDDVVYTDNTGALAASPNATGTAGSSATAYTNAAAVELATARAAAVTANTTGFVAIDGTTTGATATNAAAAAALNTLNLITPVDFAVATVPVHSVLVAGITAATAAGGLTFAQNIALNAAYGNTATAGTVTPATTMIAQTIGGFVATADATVVTAAQFAAGNALLDTYIAAAKAAAAVASSADTHAPVTAALLNATQTNVVNTTQAVSRVLEGTAVTESSTVTWTAMTGAGTQTIGGMTITSAAAETAANVAAVAGGAIIAGTTITTAPTAWTVGAAAGATNVFTSTTFNSNVTDLAATGTFTGLATAPTSVIVAQGNGAGTQTNVNNLAALSAALVLGATDAAVVTALQAAIANGSITVAQGNTLFGTAVAAAGTIDATELANTVAVLTPIQTTATNANTTAQAALTAALAADVTAVNTVANAIALNPTDTVAANLASPLANDEAGALQTAAAQTAAAAALTAANAVAVTGLTAANTQAANLAALKAAITVGTTDLAVVTATTNAVFNNSITAANKTAIDAAATAVTGTVGVAVTAAEKIAVDVLITALQLTNETLVADATIDAANLAAIVANTTTAAAIALAASNSGAANTATASPRAVFVFNTSDQTAGYNRVQADDRNLADLKSDANNSNNFANATVKVSYKGIDASVIVAGTGYKTSDLEINQALKLLINGDAVLKTLLVATDGPANTLVVTSLIDGAQATTALAVSVTVPAVGILSASDVIAAASAYGLAAGSTEAAVLAAMTTAKTAFDAKGDYATQLAESGAAGGNTLLTGANSTSSSDNTITGGTGTDVIVLGTTVGTDAMTSSNEKVVFSGSFGNDTIVNFAATGLGIDTLDFSALNGRGNVALNSLALDKSIVIAAPTAAGATVLTAVQIAALFTDSATAISHVYVAVDSTNIGSIWQVADAAGTAAGNVVATLVGSVDLADTSWSTLTAANFA